MWQTFLCSFRVIRSSMFSSLWLRLYTTTVCTKLWPIVWRLAVATASFSSCRQVVVQSSNTYQLGECLAFSSFLGWSWTKFLSRQQQSSRCHSFHHMISSFFFHCFNQSGFFIVFLTCIVLAFFSHKLSIRFYHSFPHIINSASFSLFQERSQISLGWQVRIVRFY